MFDFQRAVIEGGFLRREGFLFFVFFFFLAPHLWHIEVPRLGVKLEL